ncbi:hypothetical protein [Rhodopila sp.]|jgi:hypothetical protein|uniref:hypothetical protein n=1 Tax=Rhodopila sp. TaxID=2480087 RepID=UPI002CCEC9A8|nr:hypothetical protein [Rhodopila sp.]HVZ06899.1 hypothetical protein [Rhodopila sp.]
MAISTRFMTASAFGGLVAVGLMAAPGQAQAWWRGGIGVVVPPVVVGPPVVVAPAPVYAAPPVVYAPPPPAYYPRPRAWIPGHWRGGYWIPGHWA